jgi:hypothetical protein
MTGNPILVLAVALFVVSWLLERILVHLAAKRKRSITYTRPADARPTSALPSRADRGGLATPSQAASSSADTDSGRQSPSDEHGQDRRA